MMLASALGAIGSFWVFLSMYYTEGGGPGFGRESFGRLESWLTYAAPPDVPAIGFAIFGFVVTLVLAAIRMRFYLVEPTSCWICHIWKLGNQPHDRINFCWMATEVACTQIWWYSSTSKGDTVFLGIVFR